MKQILIVVLACILFSCADKKGIPYSIRGTVKNISVKTVYLEEIGNNLERPVVVDSALLAKDGSFQLKPLLKGESLYVLRGDQEEYPFAMFVNDSKEITVNADPANPDNSYTVSGSPASQSILEFNKKRKEDGQIMMESAEGYQQLAQSKKPDSLSQQQYDSLQGVQVANFQKAAEDLKKYTTDLIDRSGSPVAILYAFDLLQKMYAQYGMTAFSKPEEAAIFSKATEKFPGNTALLERKQKAASTKAPEFSLPDTSGNTVSLSSLKGKYVLVDFWASWCVPCRHENPNVVANFKEFKDKNFAILGVSLDQDKNAWMKAIHDDSLTWTHVSDLKSWDNEAAKLYNVTSIPYNVLLDPNGNIIAENITGDALKETLTKVLK